MNAFLTWAEREAISRLAPMAVAAGMSRAAATVRLRMLGRADLAAACESGSLGLTPPAPPTAPPAAHASIDAKDAPAVATGAGTGRVGHDHDDEDLHDPLDPNRSPHAAA